MIDDAKSPPSSPALDALGSQAAASEAPQSEEAATEQALDELVAALPEPLRADWVVVPKKILLQTFLASLSLGAALALWIVGLTGDLPALRWAFPAVLIALMLLTRYLPWWRGDRQAAQLKAAAQQSKQP